MIIFVTGGVRSGKSQYAEQLAIQFRKQDCKLAYIATSQPKDNEMKKRVERHQQARKRSEANWITYEYTRNMNSLLSSFQEGDVILLDCLTNLVNNELFVDWQHPNPSWKNKEFRQKVKAKIISFIVAATEKHVTLLLVSNELFQGVHPDDEGTLSYMKLLGDIHREIVALANLAIIVENGVFIKKKGEMM